MKKEVIIALDFPSEQKALAFLDTLEGENPYVKVGMELFYGAGPSFIHTLKERGLNVFLDLKLHDIPNTVQQTMKVLAGLEVDMCNLHGAGTGKMMAAGLEGLVQGTPVGKKRPLLVAVTQLTSTDQWRMNHEILIPGTVEEVVRAYAVLAKNSGLDGVVCAPGEAPMIHQSCGMDFLTVTPGIRLSPSLGEGSKEGSREGSKDQPQRKAEPAESTKQDQVRVQTPMMAKALGADCIVVGRPITGAQDPLAAYLAIRADFLGLSQ